MTAALDLRYAGSTLPDDVPRARALALAVPAPAPGRTGADAPVRRPLATVTVLCPPVETRRAAPIRLTRRGVVALSVALTALALAVVWLGAASAPESAAHTRSGPGAGAAVTVGAGDTLWSIASRVAPDRDPRAEVSALQHANRLRGADVVPGQVLRLP